MIYFLCWVAFLGILIVSTIVVAVMGKGGSRKSPAVTADESGFGDADFDEAVPDEAVPDEAMELGEPQGEEDDAFAAPAGDDFAEFESEFK